MIETKLSVKEVERIIVAYLGGVRTNIIVPNLSWGFLNKRCYIVEQQIFKYCNMKKKIIPKNCNMPIHHCSDGIDTVWCYSFLNERFEECPYKDCECYKKNKV